MGSDPGFWEWLIVKTAAISVAILAVLKPVKAITLYIWRSKERMDKLNEIHDAVVMEGGLKKRLETIQDQGNHTAGVQKAWFEHQEHPVFVFNENADITFCNTGFAAALETGVNEVMGRGWKNHVSDEVGTALENRVREKRSASIRNGKYLFVTKKADVEGQTVFVGTIKQL